MTQSSDILRNRAEKNLKNILNPNTDVESGLQKLAKMLEFRDKQAKNQGLKHLNKTVSEDFKAKKNKLNNLETIA